MAISKSYKDNFATLIKAVNNGDIVLMECNDAETGEPVITVAAIYLDKEKGEYCTVPLAKMFDGNPYEELIPPTIQ